MLKFLYSTLGTVNVTGAVVDSIVDLTGQAPNITASSTARPAWDSVLKLVTGDGVNDRLATVSSAVFDLTTIKAIVTIAAFNDTAPPTRYLGSIADSLSENRLLANINNATNISSIAGAAPVYAAADSGVARSTAMRITIASHNGLVTLTGQALSHTAATAVIPPLGSGNNRFTVLDAFPANGENATGPWRATLGLSDLTAGDLTVLATWGTRYHSVVLSS